MLLPRSRVHFSLYLQSVGFKSRPKFATRLSPLPIARLRHAAQFSTVTRIPIDQPSTPAGNIAPTTPGRNLILCFDGTGNSYAHTSTNIVKLYSILEKDGETQMTYYQPGLGTYVAPGFWNRPIQTIASALDKAFATHLESHVCGGYRFLQENYRHGDRIYLFGFSRGAYIARALAGMIHKVGLLGKDNTEQLHFAYKLYKGHSNFQECNGFRRTFSRVVAIDFLGCWDTVASIGYIYGPTLAYTRNNRMVKVFRHALALDERRAKYPANYWQDRKLARDVIIDQYSYGNIFSNTWRWIAQKVGIAKQPSADEWEWNRLRKKAEQVMYRKYKKTDAREVWFAGSHCDVGGGSVANDEIHSLANPSLRWMVNELLSNCPEIKLKLDNFALVTLGLQEPSGLAFYNFKPTPKDHKKSEAYTEMQQSLRSQPVRPTCLTQLAVNMILDRDNGLSPSKSEKAAQDKAGAVLHFRQHCEISDIISPIHDQLDKWRWRILEYMPLERFRVVKLKDSRDGKLKPFLRRFWIINRGRGRPIPARENIYFHYTVQQRLNCKALNYQFKARFEDENQPEPQYVYDASFDLEQSNGKFK